MSRVEAMPPSVNPFPLFRLHGWVGLMVRDLRVGIEGCRGAMTTCCVAMMCEQRPLAAQVRDYGVPTLVRDNGGGGLNP